MKKLIPLLFLTLLLGFAGTAQVKIGLPSGSPQASSILDLSNTGDGTKAFTLPRVASTASIVLPIEGMLIYDISSGCIKAYETGAWTTCLSQPTTPAVGVNCGSTAINGLYTQNAALTSANTMTVVVVNNSFSTVTITPSITDIVFSGVGAPGISVASVTPASVSPGPGGGTSNIVYTFSGTPTAVGSFTATWTKLSLTCAKTGAVCLAIAPITVSNTTTPSPLPATIVAGNTINFTAAGGTPNTGLTWAITSTPSLGMFTSATTGTGATATAVLSAGAIGSVTVTYTATNACGLLVTGTETVSVGELSVNFATSTFNGIYTQNAALTAANTVAVVVVNNATSIKTITPSTTDIVLSGTGAAGITVASVSPSSAINLPANGGTSTIIYTLGGTPTTVGPLTASWKNGALNYAQSKSVCAAISPIIVSNTTTPSPLVAPIVAGNTVDFTAAGGTPNTGITWTMTSSPSTGIFSNSVSGTGNTAQAVLVAGASGNITVIFTATNACGLLVTGTQTVNITPLYVNCATSAINGNYNQNVALTAANTLTVIVVNNGSADTTITASVADIVFGGTAGMSVASVSPASVSIPANGGTRTFTYVLSGTPTSTGAFTVSWSKLTMSCVKTGNICATMSVITVSNTTNPATLPSIIVAGNTINFTATGGLPNTGVIWTMTSSPSTGVFSSPASGSGNTAQAILVANTLGTITVVFTATNTCGLSVTGTETVNTGDVLRTALAATSGCPSCADYDAAGNNTWVVITAADYANLNTILSTTLAGASESIMNQTNQNSELIGRSNVIYGATVPLVPANNYVIAFSAISTSNVQSNDVNLKYSSNVNSGYSTGGAKLTIPAVSSLTRIYNILKRPSAVINVLVPSYVGIYTGSTTRWLGMATFNGINRYFDGGDVASLSLTDVNVTQYQVMVTATKKW